jgi:hypothetical protein
VRFLGFPLLASMTLVSASAIGTAKSLNSAAVLSVESIVITQIWIWVLIPEFLSLLPPSSAPERPRMNGVLTLP